VVAHRNHHFVPQFYLRNFGSGGTVSVYNLARGRHLLRASIRGQCQRPQLYGSAGRVEKMLGIIESAAGAAVGRIIESGERPRRSSPDYMHMLAFLVFQKARTPASGRDLELFQTRSTTAIMRSMGEPPDAAAAHAAELNSPNPVMESLQQALWSGPLLMDLHLKLLTSTGPEFITSDAPVVFFNQWCQDAPGPRATGLASGGLLVFLPLSPRRVLLLYDGDVYKVGAPKQGTVAIVDRAEVDQVNALQLLVAEQNLYYSGSRETERAIDALPFDLRQGADEIIRAQRLVAPDGRELISTYYAPPKIRLDVSFLSSSKRMLRVPQQDRIKRYRKPALLRAGQEVPDASRGSGRRHRLVKFVRAPDEE
jgi:hypothetical protein